MRQFWIRSIKHLVGSVNRNHIFITADETTQYFHLNMYEQRGYGSFLDSAGTHYQTWGLPHVRRQTRKMFITAVYAARRLISGRYRDIKSIPLLPEPEILHCC